MWVISSYFPFSPLSKGVYLSIRIEKIDKSEIIEQDIDILNEMKVMRKIDHPFITKLVGALQDNRYIYFVLELLQGGELFKHLSE